jgi:hypothetical protein
MSQDRAEGEIGQTEHNDKGQGRLLADRSSHWPGRPSQANGPVHAKAEKVKDTRRFADGRTR